MRNVSLSRYVTQLVAKTRCSKCEQPVTMLCREDGDVDWPWFYICFPCTIITEVGVGQVCADPEKPA